MSVTRKSPSHRYQHLFHELPWDMTTGKALQWDSSHSLGCVVGQDAEFLEVLAKLHILAWEIGEQILSQRQKQLVAMLRQGMTYKDMADALGINIGSVQKALYGRVDGPHCWGGIAQKLRKALAVNPQAQLLLAELDRIRNPDV